MPTESQNLPTLSGFIEKISHEKRSKEMSKKVDYSNWNLKQIKDELKKRGKRVSGRKIDLISR